MVDRLNETNKSLWMGAVEPWMDENYIKSLFATIAPNAQVLQVRVVRNPTPPPGTTGCYAFIEFETHEQALRVLQTWNNKPYPRETNLPGVFRLGWAQNAATKNVPDYSIFIGDLPPGVTDEMLFDLFAAKYQSVRTARIVTDKDTGQSKGYGFVRFLNEEESKRALVEMQGTYLLGKPIRISQATPRRDIKPDVTTAFATSPFTSGMLDPASYSYYMQMWYSQYMTHATQHWYSGYVDPSLSVSPSSTSVVPTSSSTPNTNEDKTGSNVVSSQTLSNTTEETTAADSIDKTSQPNSVPNVSVSTTTSQPSQSHSTTLTNQSTSTTLFMFNVDDENERFIRDRISHVAFNPHFTPRLAVPSSLS